MGLFSRLGRKGAVAGLSGGIVLLCAAFSILAQDDTAWVDADGPGDYGDGTLDSNFTSLDAVLASIHNTGYDVEVIVFAGENQHTYSWSEYVGQNPGTVKFVGLQDDPDNYTIINHIGTESTYNFGDANNLTFEKIILTGTNEFELGQTQETHSFLECIIRGFTGSSAISRGGNEGGTTNFINCLFEGNTSDAVLDLNFWAGAAAPAVNIINCTFDENTNIFGTNDVDVYNGITIMNCIFSNNGTTFPGNNLRSVTTYSMTSEVITDYGTGCVSGSDPDYLVSSRSDPSDWRPSPSSAARNIGTAAGAPTLDISDTVRIEDDTDKRDAGCWDIRDTVQPPSFTQNLPADTVVAAGDPITLSVVVDGTLPFTYAWFFVGDVTEQGDENELTLEGLTIDDDSLKVYCEAANSKGTVSSDTVTIIVIDEAPVITDEPEPFFGYAGDAAVFNITATGKLLTYTWLKNGTVNPFGTSDEYISSNIEETDSGAVYQCIVSNVVGTDTSEEVLLHVFPDYPILQSATGDTILTEGDDVTLRVTVTGRPTPTFSWIEVNDGSELSDADTLRITNAEVTDSVFYRCIVSNSEGEDSVDIKLAVLPGSAPVITTQSRTDISIRSGEDLDLFVTAEGGGTFTYVWYKGGLTPADSIGNSTILSISSIDEGDAGIYRCIVSSGFGSDTSSPITVSVVTSTIFNVLSLEAHVIDPTHVLLTIGNYSDLPVSASSPPYVDSIGVWYNDLTYPTVPFSSDDGHSFIFSLADILASGGNTFDTTVQFSQIPASCISRYFAVAPLWNDPDSIPAATTSEQRSSVELCAPGELENAMVLIVDYTAVSDSVTVTVSNLKSIDRDSLMYLILTYRFGESGTPDSIEIYTGEQLPDASVDIFNRVFKDERLAGVEDSLTVSVSWRGILGNFSTEQIKIVTVGRMRPENSAKLSADSATVSSIFLHWENADAVDSVRLWWGRLEVPAGIESETPIFTSSTFSADESETVIDSLLSAEKYFFGLQVMKNGVWSLISEGARDTLRTLSPYYVAIPNTSTLTSAVFDSLTSEFTLTWDVDTTGIAAIDILETGIVWAVNQAPDSTLEPSLVFGIIDSSLSVADNSITFNLDNDLHYSSTYHFALLLRRKGDVWAKATNDSRGTVTVPEPKQEEISYFIDTDTVTAFGQQVWFWKVGDAVMNITDTIRFFMPETVLDGFVIAGSVGFDLVDDSPSDPITIGIRYDSALIGELPVSDIRMYQYDKKDDCWFVINDVTIDSVNAIVSTVTRPADDSLPFLLMIDTLAPVMRFLTDTSTVVEPNTAIIDTVVISDNVANCTVRLTYWHPDEEKDAREFKCKYSSDTLAVSIPKDSVTALKSVRTFLTVTDGVHTGTVESSRRVNRESSDPIYADSMQWVPVFTTAHLEKPSVEVSLNALSEDDPWKYDKKMFRIFRWMNTAGNKNDGTTTSYVEYSSKDPTIFDLVPGRVLWVKAREGIDLPSLGSGITIAMKRPFEILCDGDSQWTDIALPYNFDITIGDIFDATSDEQTIRENILIYKWILDTTDKKIYPRPKYLPRAVGLDSLTTALSYKLANDGLGSYTVMNRNTNPLTMKIPAVPVSFSRIGSTGAAKKIQHSGWTVLVEPFTEDGRPAPVCCGYSNNDTERVTTYPNVPTFCKQRVAVVNAENNSAHGTMIFHDSDEGGGVFPLEFSNSDKTPSRIGFTVDKITDLPDDYRIALYNPDDRNVIDVRGENNVRVAATAKAKRWLLVGDSAFISAWRTRFMLSQNFSLLRLFPNPCRGVLQIRFSLPYDDVHHMTFTVYNQLGRRVWNQEFKGVMLNAGENAIVWNPVTSRSRLGAGTYIIQMNIFNSSGAMLGSKMRRILYLP